MRYESRFLPFKLGLGLPIVATKEQVLAAIDAVKDPSKELLEYREAIEEQK